MRSRAYIVRVQVGLFSRIHQNISLRVELLCAGLSRIRV